MLYVWGAKKQSTKIGYLGKLMFCRKIYKKQEWRNDNEIK